MENSPFSELEETTPKSKKWVVIIEKILGVSLTFFGVTVLYTLFSTLSLSFQRDYLPISKVNQVQELLLERGFALVMAVFFVIGGILLVSKKKIGWFFSSVAVTLMVLWVIYHVYDRIHLGYRSLFDVLNLFSILLLLVFIAMAYVLFGKEMRIRYCITRKDYLVVLSSVLVFTVVRAFNLYFL